MRLDLSLERNLSQINVSNGENISLGSLWEKIIKWKRQERQKKVFQPINFSLKVIAHYRLLVVSPHSSPPTPHPNAVQLYHLLAWVWVKRYFLWRHIHHSCLCGVKLLISQAALLKTYHAGEYGQSTDSSSPYAQSKWKLRTLDVPVLETQPWQKGFQSGCSK